MKQVTRIFVVFLIVAAFYTLPAQDFAVDPYPGASGYDPGAFSVQTAPAPQNGIAGSAFHEEGIASWYGTEFEGHPTASGELFNPAQLTAAHPSLPFGTMLRVTNTQNRRQVTVRVNDRGPFVNTRIIDVSRAAAEILDIISTGTAPVVVELEPETAMTPPPAQQAAPDPWAAPIPDQPSSAYPGQPPVYPGQSSVYPAQPPALGNSGVAAVVTPKLPPLGTNKRYRIQVGAYKVSRNAVEAFDRVKSLGIEPAYERHDEYYRVVISGMRAEDIENLAGRLGSVGFREILVREE